MKNPNPNTQKVYANAEGTNFIPTGEVRIPVPGENYVSTRFFPGTVRTAQPGAHYSGAKVIVRMLDASNSTTATITTVGPNAGIDATPGAIHQDSDGNDFQATGEVRLPRAGEFYVSNSTEPGVVHGPLGVGITRRTPKVIVTPLDIEDSDETEDSTAEDLTNQFFEASLDGAAFYDENGNAYEATGDVRLPEEGEFYVSNNSAPGTVLGPAASDGYTTAKVIVQPINADTEDTESSEPLETVGATVDALMDALGLDGGHNTPSGEARDHPLARFVRDVNYQQAGRSTSAVVTVILPGTGATAVLVGNGLSVANPEDKFSRSEGRRIATLRALNNIAANL